LFLHTQFRKTGQIPRNCLQLQWRQWLQSIQMIRSDLLTQSIRWIQTGQSFQTDQLQADQLQAAAALWDSVESFATSTMLQFQLRVQQAPRATQEAPKLTLVLCPFPEEEAPVWQCATFSSSLSLNKQCSVNAYM
jgi:hypothetical protein